jgi:hypothetical protein
MEITLKFSVERLNEILIAMSSLSFSQVNGIMAEIHQQAQPQVDAYNVAQETAKVETDAAVKRALTEQTEEV